jgi:hypothetical protein
MDVLGWFEGRKILEPEASGLAGIVAELIWLDYLIGFADAGADTAGGVFEGDPVDGRIEEELDEGEGFFGLGRAAGAAFVPVEAGGAEVGAGRVGDEQIPRVVEDVADIALVVIAGRGGWQEVAGPCFVTGGGEGIADGARKLTGHKHSHG